MSVPLALLVFGVVVMAVAPRLLPRRSWVQAAPRWGILAWQACTGAVLGSFLLLALTAALPVDRISFDVEHLLHACAAVLRDRYEVHLAAWIALGSATLAALVAALLVVALLTRARRLALIRARQRNLVDLVARDLDAHGAHLLPHRVPLAYCIPGQRGRIVLTTAAASALAEPERAAVVAHERAHLRGRHHLVLLGADVARAAFPWLPYFDVAQRQTAGLVEMLADDCAARSSGALSVANALLGLGAHVTPPGGLGASGEPTVERVLRLVDGAARPSSLHRAGVLLQCTLLLGAPWAIALAPAWAAHAGRCPVPL